ncbi:MAG: hypothetical protein CR217_04660 [Beijerinckiaceae bacterium]|nr:MAG: hypothetical protein CR217_04660 [Beijerinckiaceae bacterium]
MRSNSKLRCEGFGDARHLFLLARTVGLCPAYGRGPGGSGKPARAAVRRFSRRHQEYGDATARAAANSAKRRGGRLAEAEERGRPGALNQPAARKEINGRDGPEPVRYGDWELRGFASDF